MVVDIQETKSLPAREFRVPYPSNLSASVIPRSSTICDVSLFLRSESPFLLVVHRTLVHHRRQHDSNAITDFVSKSILSFNVAYTYVSANLLILREVILGVHYVQIKRA